MKEKRRRWLLETDEREEEMDIDERKEIILASGRDIKLR
jgi:hypothetical protein